MEIRSQIIIEFRMFRIRYRPSWIILSWVKIMWLCKSWVIEKKKKIKPTFLDLLDELHWNISFPFKGVMSGQITDVQLRAQLNSGNLTHTQKEAISAVLKRISYSSPNSLMPHRANLTPSPTPQVLMSSLFIHAYSYTMPQTRCRCASTPYPVQLTCE